MNEAHSLALELAVSVVETISGGGRSTDPGLRPSSSRSGGGVSTSSTGGGSSTGGARTHGAEIEHHCPHCGADSHGVPTVLIGQRRVHVSIGRAGDVIAAAAVPDGAVGIDVERADAAGFDGFTSVAVHAAERVPSDPAEATRLWVRKEAVLKALGTGLRVDPRLIRLADTANGPVVVDWPDPRPPNQVTLVDLDAPDGYLAALAVIGGSGLAYTHASIRPATPASL